MSKIGNTSMGGKGSVKSQGWRGVKVNGMKNLRKKKKRLAREAAKREAIAKQQKKESRDQAFAEEWGTSYE